MLSSNEGKLSSAAIDRLAKFSLSLIIFYLAKLLSFNCKRMNFNKKL